MHNATKYHTFYTRNVIAVWSKLWLKLWCRSMKLRLLFLDGWLSVDQQMSEWVS